MVETQKEYFLQRGSKPVPVEPEAEYFTVALNQRDDEARAMDVLSKAGIPRDWCRRVGRADLKVRVKPEDLGPAITKLTAEQKLVCQRAYRPAGSTASRYYIGDRVFVRLKEPLGSNSVTALLGSCGISPDDVTELKGRGGYAIAIKVKDTTQRDAVELASELARQSGVIYAEPDTIERFQGYPATTARLDASPGEVFSPSEDLFRYQWYLDSKASPLLQQFIGQLIDSAGISVKEAWQRMRDGGKGRGDPRVVVGLIDEGFKLDHPDLAANRLDRQMNFEDIGDVPIDRDPGVESARHGTPCAGLAVAGRAGQGVVGVAPECHFVVARKLLEGRVMDMENAVREVAKDADVLSWSFSLVPSDAGLPQLLDDAFTEISETGGPERNGCVLCFAAGNWNAPLDDPQLANFKWRERPGPNYPIRTFTGRCFNGYAAHKSVLAVAACTSTGRRAAYSNYGKHVSLCAPSSNFDPLDVQRILPGLGIVTTDNETEGDGYNPRSLYTGLLGDTAFGGTSAATPLVAGVAALVRSVNRDLSAAKVREILTNTTTKIGSEPGGEGTGNSPGAYQNGRSAWFGYGRVNAAAAVGAAFDTLPR